MEIVDSQKTCIYILNKYLDKKKVKFGSFSDEEMADKMALTDFCVETVSLSWLI